MSSQGYILRVASRAYIQINKHMLISFKLEVQHLLRWITMKLSCESLTED